MLDIDEGRFERAFEAYSAIGATDAGGLHRLTLTDEDRRARDKFVEDCEALGLEVWVDRIGNIFARREGRDPDADPVLFGSHLDSQPKGGRYDGQLGILSGLETMRALEDAGIETERPLELVNWTNEEGSRFKQGLMGSFVFSGQVPLDEALDSPDMDEETTVRAELDRIGYDGDRPVGDHEVDSYLELHIEQGPTLAEGEDTVGVVEGVYASTWLEVTITGESDHAGPTPMDDRRDAFAACAGATDRIFSLPNRLDTDAVATVGEVRVSPNKRNVIPNEVRFSVDFRAAGDTTIDEAKDRIASIIDSACAVEGTDYEIEELLRKHPTEFADRVKESIEGAAEGCGVPHRRMPSVAGHDAMPMASVTDAGMIFVPSVGGVSHNEEEFTPMEDALDGARVFANAVLDLAGD